MAHSLEKVTPNQARPAGPGQTGWHPAAQTGIFNQALARRGPAARQRRRIRARRPSDLAVDPSPVGRHANAGILSIRGYHRGKRPGKKSRRAGQAHREKGPADQPYAYWNKARVETLEALFESKQGARVCFEGKDMTRDGLMNVLVQRQWLAARPSPGSYNAAACVVEPIILRLHKP
ncbi:hypothetical protein [Chromobacterium violaceum]|uniref:hypothetical protein n=1 Tax=Chromobacterium violaceum TaxID=536 RepID=UPI000AC31FF4|nr:hypothetical protein [Chromobacterium violaceum]